MTPRQAHAAMDCLIDQRTALNKRVRRLLQWIKGCPRQGLPDSRTDLTRDMQSAARTDGAPPPSIAWQRPHYEIAATNFPHWDTYASCGADRPALVVKVPGRPHAA
jgi:hypothetical protein